MKMQSWNDNKYNYFVNKVIFIYESYYIYFKAESL